ncbi:MAG TPA: PQQ-binding-like beta-propeller repeat protein [Actinomycetota bacterium]|nr:PQQ-binding-like beta-propeller repeat protein [Actinomycetota bacterium]
MLDGRYARAVRVVGVLVAAVAVARIVVADAAAGQETQPAGWPQFQGGPKHDGFRADGPEPPYRVRWSLPDPSGDRLSSAIVVGDEAIAVGPDAVYGIALSDGAIAWEIPRGGGVLSTPAVGSVDGEQVLVYLEGPPAESTEEQPSPSASVSPPTGTTGAETTTPSPVAEDGDASASELVGVTLADRTERWRVELEASSLSGVTIDGDTVFVGDQDGTLAAYGLGDGEFRWSNAVTGRIDTPVAVADGSVYAVARDSDDVRVTLVAFDAVTGERSWPPFTVPATSTAGSAASAADGRLVVGSADRVVRAVSADAGTEEWASLVLSLFPPATAPAFADGSVFVADFGGGLYRLDADDGDRVWSHQLNEVIVRGLPVVSGDAVLVGVGDGRLIAADAASGHLVWEQDLTAGSLGAIAIGEDVVIAVTGGPESGLIALETDPEGTLIDVPSPTEFDAGTTFARYAAAAAIVFLGAFIPGVFARRRFGSGIEQDGEDTDGDLGENNALSDEEDSAS